MIVGLGTGSTARFAIEALIRRVRDGLRIRAIPTSKRSAAQARAGGIPLTTFAEHRRIDITIDGADEIQIGTLQPDQGSRRRAAARKDRCGGERTDGHRRRWQETGRTAWRNRAGAGRGRAVRLGNDGGPPASSRHRAAAAARCDRPAVLHRRRQPDPRLPVRHDRRSGRPGSGHRADCRCGGDRPVHRHGPVGTGRRRWRRPPADRSASGWRPAAGLDAAPCTPTDAAPARRRCPAPRPPSVR